MSDMNSLRVIRNTLAHDYPQDDGLKAACLNEAVAAVAVLESLLDKVVPVVDAIR